MTVYTLEPGRVIARDGEPVAIIRTPGSIYDFTDPARRKIDDQTDALAHRLVAMLNDFYEEGR